MKLLREASPAAVSWRFLSCRVHELTAGETISLTSASEETLLVLVAGSIHVAGEGIDEIVSRETLREGRRSCLLPASIPGERDGTRRIRDRDRLRSSMGGLLPGW